MPKHNTNLISSGLAPPSFPSSRTYKHSEPTQRAPSQTHISSMSFFDSIFGSKKSEDHEAEKLEEKVL